MRIMIHLGSMLIRAPDFWTLPFLAKSRFCKYIAVCMHLCNVMQSNVICNVIQYVM